LGDVVKSKMGKIDEIDTNSNYSNINGNFESGKRHNT